MSGLCVYEIQRGRERKRKGGGGGERKRERRREVVNDELAWSVFLML